MHSREWEWIGSEVLATERENTPDIEKRNKLFIKNGNIILMQVTISQVKFDLDKEEFLKIKN